MKTLIIISVIVIIIVAVFFPSGQLEKFLKTYLTKRNWSLDRKKNQIIKQSEYEGFISKLNLRIIVLYSGVIGIVVFIATYLLSNSYWYSSITNMLMIGGVAFLFVFIKTKKNLGEEATQYKVPAGSVGLIYTKGSLTKKIFTESGNYKKTPDLPFFSDLIRIDPFKIDQKKIDLTIENILTSGTDRQPGQLMKISVSVMKVPVDLFKIIEIGEDTADAHIEDVTKALMKDTLDEIDFHSLFGIKGTESFNEKMRGQIDSYKKDGKYFSSKDPKAFLEKFDLRKGPYDPLTGYKLEFLLNYIVPQDSELMNSLAKKAVAEALAAAEKIRGVERIELVKQAEEGLKDLSFFKDMTASEKETHISNLLNLVEEGTSSKKIFDFGLSGEDLTQFANILAGIFKKNE